jgi:hypothetical protein
VKCSLLRASWFPEKDSNLRSRIQSPLPYRLAIRDLPPHTTSQGAGGWLGCVTFGRRVALGLVMRNVLLAALVLVTAACGAYRFPGGATPGEGTVSGTVVAFPCFPVAQPVGQPAAQAIPACVSPCFPVAQPAPDQALPKCTPRPIGAGAAITCFPVQSAGVAQCAGRPVPGVEIDFTSGGETGKAVTDSTGHFTAALAAGTWTVHLVTTLHIASGPQELTVVAGSTATANYVLDSGIRVPVPQQ